MGLISPGGQNLLDFLELRQVLSTYDGNLRDPLWWRQERPVPMRVARKPLVMSLPLQCVLNLDWPFLRPPERVPAVPVVSREHLPQLEKIKDVLPSRQNEAYFR